MDDTPDRVAHVNGSDPVRAAEVALFDRAGTHICIDGTQEVPAWPMAGEPTSAQG